MRPNPPSRQVTTDELLDVRDAAAGRSGLEPGPGAAGLSTTPPGSRRRLGLCVRTGAGAWKAVWRLPSTSRSTGQTGYAPVRPIGRGSPGPTGCSSRLDTDHAAAAAGCRWKWATVMVRKVDVPAELMHGDADEGYGPVADAFRRTFTERGEIGAACAIYRDGRKVVDLYRDVLGERPQRPTQRQPPPAAPAGDL